MPRRRRRLLSEEQRAEALRLLKRALALRRKVVKELKQIGITPKKGETVGNFLERLFLSFPVTVKTESSDEFFRALNDLIPYFHDVVDCVLMHYQKRITFGFSDLRHLKQDMEQECYLGLVRALLRVVEAYAGDYDKVYRYVMKVVRSHIKNFLSVSILTARIPPSKWRALTTAEKENFVPVSLNNHEKNHLSAEDEVETDLPCADERDAVRDFELHDFISKLPEPYKSSVLYFLDEVDEGEIPGVLRRLFAAYAMILYYRLS